MMSEIDPLHYFAVCNLLGNRCIQFSSGLQQSKAQRFFKFLNLMAQAHLLLSRLRGGRVIRVIPPLVRMNCGEFSGSIKFAIMNAGSDKITLSCR